LLPQTKSKDLRLPLPLPLLLFFWSVIPVGNLLLSATYPIGRGLLCPAKSETLRLFLNELRTHQTDLL
jgi:hypothetical protein